MERISLKTLLLVVLIGFAHIVAFAQDGGSRPESFTITFNADGGIPDTSSKTFVPDGLFEMPPEPRKDNYLFLGWFTEKNGGGDQFSQKHNVTKNMTVYALWGGEITVTFDPDGGTVDTLSKRFPRGHIMGGNDLSTPKKQGFSFLGWFTEKNGSGSKFEKGAEITESRTVFADWDDVTVTFDANGGGDLSPKIIPGGHNIGDLQTPKKQNYLFLGWFTDKDGKFNENSPLTHDVTLYAKWVDYRILIVLAAVTMVLLSLIVFSIVFAVGVNKKLQKLSTQIETCDRDHKKKINDAKQEMQDQYDRIDQEFRAVSGSVNIPRSHNTVQATVSEEAFLQLSKRVNSLENSRGKEMHDLREKEIHDFREKEVHDLRENEKIINDLASGDRDRNRDIQDVFNDWASNPSSPLPKSFYFIYGDMNIRTKCEIKESPVETLWISNYGGLKKYLFPNPRLFYQMTDILGLYKMDQAKLKSKGQNRIKVTNACEMTNDGFVEFPGELDIL
jgi:uncharacterized repeat protein (TIGR02543 family)